MTPSATKIRQNLEWSKQTRKLQDLIPNSQDLPIRGTILNITIYDLNTRKVYMMRAFPYPQGKQVRRKVNEFQTKI
jgi:hypothetical protein